MVQFITRSAPLENKNQRYIDKFAEDFSSSVSKGIQQHQASKVSAQDAKLFQEQYGADISGYSPDMRKEVMSHVLKGKEGEEKQKQELAFYRQVMGQGGPAGGENSLAPQQQEQFNEVFESQVVPNFEKDFGFTPQGKDREALYAKAAESAGMSQPRQAQQPQDSIEQDMQKAEALGFMGKAPAVSAINKRIDIAQKRQEAQVSQRNKDREFYSKRSDKYLEKMDTERDALNVKESALENIKAANEEMSGGFGLDQVADIMHLPGLRSSKAALFKAEIKEFFLGNISKAGARPNQWVEQQIMLMMPQVGMSKEANATVIAALDANVKVERQRVELAGQLEEKYLKELGYVPSTIAKEVDALLKPYSEEIQKKLSYDMKRIEENSKNPLDLQRLVKVSPGTPLTLQKAEAIYKKAPGKTDEEREENAAKMAKKLGYKIMTDEFYESVK